MSEELVVLLDVAARLSGAGLGYMLTGSMASNVYAMPRMTRDIDVVVELGGADAEQIIRLFADDYYLDPDAVATAVALRGMFNAIHTAHIVKVDFVVRKDSEYRQEEFRRRRAIEIAGQSLDVVSPEDLILSKLDWARETRSPTQLEDVRNLLSAVEDLDRDYLDRWARVLGVVELLDELRR